jgi:hypothetical protein
VSEFPDPSDSVIGIECSTSFNHADGNTYNYDKKTSISEPNSALAHPDNINLKTLAENNFYLTGNEHIESALKAPLAGPLTGIVVCAALLGGSDFEYHIVRD